MNPKTKILAASLVVLVLGTLASVSGMNAAMLARLVLGGVAASGVTWWFVKARHARAGEGEKPRLNVVARTGLSQRTGLALIEVDGTALLIVHGEGFAEVHRPRRARRPSSFRSALRESLELNSALFNLKNGKGVMSTAAAQAAVDMNQSFASSPLPMMGMLALMALVPFAVVMLTSFSKMAVVLSLMRSALGTQQAPPTIVLTGLAAVLTAHVMAPVFEQIWVASKATYELHPTGDQLVDAAGPTLQPLKDFLEKHGGAEERARFLDMARDLRPADQAALVTEHDLTGIIPAFVITELKEAFTIGFLIFLPFLVLDMLIANVLLALGMQTLSPSQVSLPFKILLFVAVDGWALLARGLILGYR